MAGSGRKKAAAEPGPAAALRVRLERRLAVHLGRDVVEGRAEAGADILHGGNGGDGDQRGDQAILDGGGALLIADDFANEAHFRSPVVKLRSFTARGCPLLWANFAV